MSVRFLLIISTFLCLRRNEIRGVTECRISVLFAKIGVLITFTAVILDVPEGRTKGRTFMHAV